MSKFKDKLTRLHGSRVRALETEEPGAPRVFVAEPEELTSPVVSPVVEQAVVEEPKPVRRKAQRADTPARKAVRNQLELGQRVRSKKPQRVRMQRDELPPEAEPQTRRPTEPSSDNAVGERLTELRMRAEALIEVGGLESALPLLHEMAALSPTHTFPLTQLAAYWRSKGNERLAELYASRLSAVAPY